MAKRIPRHIPSLPDPVIVKNGKVINQPAKVISMDGNILAHDLGNGKFQIADDRFGEDCCCGSGGIPCDACCNPNRAPFNCCRPISDIKSPANSIHDYTLTNLIIMSQSGVPPDYSTAIITQTADMDMYANEGCRYQSNQFPGYFVPVHAEYHFRHHSFDDFDLVGDGTPFFQWARFFECFVGCNCCGAEAPPIPSCNVQGADCDNAVVRALENVVECQGGNTGCTRSCVLLETGIDTTNWCFQYDESWSHTFPQNGQYCPGGHIEFSYSFSIVQNVKSCNKTCSNCA